MPPRRRASDQVVSIVLRALGTIALTALTFAASFLMTQKELNARNTEKLIGNDEMKEQQIHARDRELDDLKARLGRLEERCK